MRTEVEANEGTQDGNKNGKRGTGPESGEERRICARKPRRVVDIMWKSGETWAKGAKTKKQSVISVAAN